MSRCEVDREFVETQQDCCPVCDGPARVHLTAQERAAEYHARQRQPQRDEVRVQLPRELWEAVVASMGWPITGEGYPDPAAARQHGKRCSLANECIRHALGDRSITERRRFIEAVLQRSAQRKADDAQNQNEPEGQLVTPQTMTITWDEDGLLHQTATIVL